MQSEIRDWSPPLSRPGVTSLMISDEEARDLRVPGKLVRLEKMHLWLRAPWPDLSGLENLPCFRELHYTDLTPLAELPCLHEIVIEHSPVVPAELDSLNSLCNPWDEEFAAAPPRRPTRRHPRRNALRDEGRVLIGPCGVFALEILRRGGDLSL